MSVYKDFVNEISERLDKIKSSKTVTKDDINSIRVTIKRATDGISSNDAIFHNVIQTVSSSLGPEAAYYCNESLYFSYTFSILRERVK